MVGRSASVRGRLRSKCSVTFVIQPLGYQLPKNLPQHAEPHFSIMGVQIHAADQSPGLQTRGFFNARMHVAGMFENFFEQDRQAIKIFSLGWVSGLAREAAGLRMIS